MKWLKENWGVFIAPAMILFIIFYIYLGTLYPDSIFFMDDISPQYNGR